MSFVARSLLAAAPRPWCHEVVRLRVIQTRSDAWGVKLRRAETVRRTAVRAYQEYWVHKYMNDATGSPLKRLSFSLHPLRLFGTAFTFIYFTLLLLSSFPLLFTFS